jgi:O-antigen/teichoic acid export membrane protein
LNEFKEVNILFNEANASKNIWFTSISIIVPSVFTYLFWFVTAKITGAEAVGIASSISSLVIIIATIDGLDMSLGMKRSLGLAISAGDIGRFKQILVSTVVFVSMIAAISSILIAIPNLQLLEVLKIDRQYAWIIIAMIFGMSFQYIFSEALIAALRSKDLVMPFLWGSLSRFPILFGALFLFNAPTIGTVIAFSSLIFITAALFGVYSIKIFRASKVRITENMYSNIKNVLKAGLSSWIPHTANVCGYWLGVITVFSTQGAANGGKYYIAIGIFMVILFIVVGITKVTHALIASIDKEEQQTKFLFYSMKIAFMFTMPIATPLLFFSKDFLGIMGKEFSSAAGSLSIFMASVPMVIISEMVYYFVYGKGDHKSVLYLGLMGNVPRVILYFALGPLLGINGAAVSYLVGSVIQLVWSAKVLGNRHLLEVEFKKYAVLTLIPIIIGVTLWLINLNFMMSTVIVFVGSFIVYIKIHLFADRELHDLLFAGLPKSIAVKSYPVISKIIQRID